MSANRRVGIFCQSAATELTDEGSMPSVAQDTHQAAGDTVEHPGQQPVEDWPVAPPRAVNGDESLQNCRFQAVRSWSANRHCAQTHSLRASSRLKGSILDEPTVAQLSSTTAPWRAGSSGGIHRVQRRRRAAFRTTHAWHSAAAGTPCRPEAAAAPAPPTTGA